MQEDKQDVLKLVELSKRTIYLVCEIMVKHIEIIQKKDKHIFSSDLKSMSGPLSTQGMSNIVQTLMNHCNTMEVLYGVPNDWEKKTNEEKLSYVKEHVAKVTKEVQEGLSKVLKEKTQETEKEETKEEKKVVEMKEKPKETKDKEKKA